MSEKYKIIVAGGRDIDEYKVVEDAIIEFTHNHMLEHKIEIVQGGAKGVDENARKYAIINNIQCRQFDADWNTHGKAAGPIRNKQMAEYADALILVWDGNSRGSKNMLKEAREKGIPVLESIVKKKWVNQWYEWSI